MLNYKVLQGTTCHVVSQQSPDLPFQYINLYLIIIYFYFFLIYTLVFY